MGPGAVGPSSSDYLWGPVGRGKTWLLDRFFEVVPTRSKVRFHLQRFFRDFNAALAGRPVARSSIAEALEPTIGNADVARARSRLALLSRPLP